MNGGSGGGRGAAAAAAAGGGGAAPEPNHHAADKGGGEGIEERIRRALACPCVARFVGGGGQAGATDCPPRADDPGRPCGRALAEAFACYHRSEAVPKGQDCLPLALAAADCLAEHPHSVLRPPLPPAPPAAGEASGGGGGGGEGESRRRAGASS